VNDAILDLYLGQWAARRDGWVKDSRAHIGEPLTIEVARAALAAGGSSVSGYTATWRGEGDTRHAMTHIGAIDFDLEDGLIRATRVRDFLHEHGITGMVMESRRGAHLWIQTIGDGLHDSEPQGMVPAGVVRRALEAAIALLDMTDPKVEVFPRPSRAEWGAGALRMPLMKHPKTGVRYPAHDPHDRPVTSLSGLLDLVMGGVSPYKALTGLAGAATTPMTYPSPGAAQRLARPRSGDVPLVSDILAGLGTAITPGRSIRCPFHEDRKASLSIADDDQRVWCKSPECPAYNDGKGIGSLALAALMRKEPRHAAPSGGDQPPRRI
jgi:hypothetical protein